MPNTSGEKNLNQRDHYYIGSNKTTNGKFIISLLIGQNRKYHQDLNKKR